MHQAIQIETQAGQKSQALLHRQGATGCPSREFAFDRGEESFDQSPSQVFATLNLYAMVSDNPESFADLDGHIEWAPFRLVESVIASGGLADILEMMEGMAGPSGYATGLTYEGTLNSESAQQQGQSTAPTTPTAQSSVTTTESAQQQDKWVDPTGGAVRGCDAGGCGNYGAPGNEGLGLTHLGTDYVAKPGQDVVAVHEGKISHVGYAYKGDSRLRSVDIKTSNGYTIKELYVAPGAGIKAGVKVSAGQVIGAAQDIRVRTGPNVTPHIHVTILRGREHINPETLIPVP
jgi:hypothetical protein